MDFLVSAATDAGSWRQVNQDRIFVHRMENSGNPMAFAVVCDGMGGLEKGEVASSVLTQAFVRWMEDFAAGQKDVAAEDHIIRRQWTAVVEQVNEWILSYSRGTGCRMGTTVTAMLLTGQRYYLLNIGDTRAYEITSRGIRQLTVDHTVIQREVERGNLTKEQAEDAPMKNVLTRCVGMEGSVCPDLFFGDTVAGAVYLLCSDGFRHRISETEIAGALGGEEGAADMQERLDNLVALNRQRGEKDNISAVAIVCRPGAAQ